MGWTERKGSKAVSQGPADKTAHIPESMLELWVNVHNYLKERIPRYHEPQEPSLQVYTWTFQTVAHNQSKRANTSSSETLLSLSLNYPASSSRIPFIYNQCKFFQNILNLVPSSLIYKNQSPTPGWQTFCLFHLALLLVV